MDITYSYQKKRSEFGRQCLFSDKGPDLIDNYPANKKLTREYILRDPVHKTVQCTAVQAEHYLNTMRAEYANSSMNHVEGGWPKDVNLLDEEQPKRYRRKVEKDENYHHTMMQLIKNMENCILQNNAFNIYQQYFSDVEPTPIVEQSSVRTVNVYQDQSMPTRPITFMSWSPDNQTKLAVSHCNLKFQAYVPNQSTHSYIWEIENPNYPVQTLKPEYPCVCLEYNPKDANSLVSGQFNGQVGVWDTRKGSTPVELSVIENSFRDPVNKVLWINSKSGTEFFSSSTDGQLKWWDTRKLSEPTETLILDPTKDDEQSMANAMGASCLEYETTIPTRFMVGTEQGYVLSCNRKGKTHQEKILFKFKAHSGPVLALQRNPGFIKNFLTIGDWTARIWSEDCRESSIMWTNYHNAMLTDGAWSPTRLSVFLTTRSDGILDCWDILQQQKQASLSVKICDEPLRCLRTHEMGRLVAIANEKGTVYLVQFSENLTKSNKNDKLLLTAMFEREGRREKILEARNREIRLKMKTKSAVLVETDEVQEYIASDSDTFADKYVIQAEAEYFNTIKLETKVEEDEEEDEEEEEMVMMPSPEEEEPVVEEEEKLKKKKKDEKGKKDDKEKKGDKKKKDEDTTEKEDKKKKKGKK